MQILVTDENPLTVAREMCDKHLLKLIVEATQLLSTHMYIVAPETYNRLDLYKPTHIRHPATTWLLESQNNVWWLLLCAHEMIMEYRYRYKKTHACKDKIMKIFEIWSEPFSTIFETQYLLKANNHTPFRQIMPDYFKIEGMPVEAYRNYVQSAKGHFATWKIKSRRPSWWYMETKQDRLNFLPGNKNLNSISK